MKKDQYGPQHMMTAHQFQAELLRCEYCEEQPCTAACPCDCSPFDFIMAARGGNPSDIRRSAGEVIRKNPLGGVCGMVCPDTLCMAACSHKLFDGAINIPALQATIVEMAKNLGGVPKFSNSEANGMKVAVVGGGPAGLAATASLAQMGYAVDIFDARDQLGGMMALIPDHRLDKKVMETDIDFVLSLGEISTKLGSKVEEPKHLLTQGYNAVCIAAGLWEPIRLGIENEDIAITMVDLLARPDAYD
ncbi:MAG: NAD(P)-binding protein, partial [Anaerolineales bacterium]|nr:NAD(P)-binding protein [Anaerolineales bacterium]